jgi:hypothetical protein
MSEQPLAGTNLDLHRNERLWVSSFDFSAQDWLSKVHPCLGVEEFVSTFDSYLEREKDTVMTWLDNWLAGNLELRSKHRQAIRSRLDSALQAKKVFWIRVARRKAEKMPRVAEPILSPSSYEASRDSNPFQPQRFLELLRREFSLMRLVPDVPLEAPSDRKPMQERQDSADNHGNSTPVPLSADPISAERTAAIEAYKREGGGYGIKITDEMIARKAKTTWHTRDPVKRWKANDPRCTREMDRLIWAVLKSKPHIPKS